MSWQTLFKHIKRYACANGGLNSIGEPSKRKSETPLWTEIGIFLFLKVFIIIKDTYIIEDNKTIKSGIWDENLRYFIMSRLCDIIKSA